MTTATVTRMGDGWSLHTSRGPLGRFPDRSSAPRCFPIGKSAFTLNGP